MNSNIKRGCRLLCIILIILACLFILWKPINVELNNNFINPIMSQISDKNWYVQIALVLIICVLYYLYWSKLKEEELSLRRELLLVFASVLLYFRLSREYQYHGVATCWPSYFDVCIIIIFICEAILFVRHIVYKKNQHFEKTDEYTSFSIECPTATDKLNRKKYAELLVNKIKNTLSSEDLEYSFTVLLSEGYGQGKTTFFNMIEDECKAKKISCSIFKPWLSSGVNQMTINFFNSLSEQIGINDRRFRKVLKTYALLTTEPLSKKISNVYLNLRDNETIEELHNKIKGTLENSKVPRIILIDDLDRLQDEELMALIKLIRNSADFPYIAYIVAADKKAISETLLSAGIKNPHHYLEKFFNFELLFPANDESKLITILKEHIEKILINFGFPTDEIENATDDIIKNDEIYLSCFTNIRDIIRYCNILSYELDTLKNLKKDESHNGDCLKDILISDLVALCMIQYISPETYKILRDYDYMLLDFAGNDLLVIKDDFSTFINDTANLRKAKKAIKINTLDDIDLEDHQQSTENKSTTEKTISSLSDFIDALTPQKTELLKHLLSKLWPIDEHILSHNSIATKGIRCVWQYFLYFAGSYGANEVSIEEAKQLFRLPEENFRKKIEPYLDKKWHPLLHKLKLITEKRDVERIVLLKNIINLSYVYYQNNKAKKSYSFGYYHCASLFNEIIANLYLRKVIDTDKYKEYKQHKDFFEESEMYGGCALAISNMHYCHSEDKNVFSQEEVDTLSRIIINRFYKNIFVNDPFGEESINAIPCMTKANPQYWRNELFIPYVNNYKNPIEWLYRLLKINGSGLIWNMPMVAAIIGENKPIFYDAASELVGEERMSKYKDRLFTISINITTEFSEDKVKSNPFLKEAFDWLKSHE